MRAVQLVTRLVRLIWMAVFLIAGWILGTLALLVRLAVAAVIEGYHMGAQVK